MSRRSHERRNRGTDGGAAQIMTTIPAFDSSGHDVGEAGRAVVAGLRRWYEAIPVTSEPPLGPPERCVARRRLDERRVDRW